MNKAPLRRIVTVINPQGLHARPADLLVRTANKFAAEIMIGKDSELVDCKSILSLLTLGASQGTELTLTASGNDAADALKSIGELFEAGFSETDSVKGVEPAVDS
jgi:phosphotransferase system HPr (HPr) family protein